MQQLINHQDLLLFFALTSSTSSELSPGYSQDHPTVQPTLEGKTLRPTNITTPCPQLQYEFALLRYLLFSSVGTICNKDVAVKNPATSPLVNPIPNTNTDPNLTSTAFLLPCASEHFIHRSTPVGAVGQSSAKRNNSANADFQPTPKTHESAPIAAQNLTSRTSELENSFSDEIATYTSITAGIHSQNFFLHDKIRQLEPW